MGEGLADHVDDSSSSQLAILSPYNEGINRWPGALRPARRDPRKVGCSIFSSSRTMRWLGVKAQIMRDYIESVPTTWGDARADQGALEAGGGDGSVIWRKTWNRFLSVAKLLSVHCTEMSDPTTRNPQFQTASGPSGLHLEREFAPSLQRFVQDLGPHETPDL